MGHGYVLPCYIHHSKHACMTVVFTITIKGEIPRLFIPMGDHTWGLDFELWNLCIWCAWWWNMMNTCEKRTRFFVGSLKDPNTNSKLKVLANIKIDRIWQTPILKIYNLFIDRSYILSDSSYSNPDWSHSLNIKHSILWSEKCLFVPYMLPWFLGGLDYHRCISCIPHDISHYSWIISH